jgi:hypothetical protein
MRSLTGVAQRKLLEDLLETRCVHQMNGLFTVIAVPATPQNGIIYYRGFVKAGVLLDSQKMDDLSLKISQAMLDDSSVMPAYVEVKSCYPEEVLKSIITTDK